MKKELYKKGSSIRILLSAAQNLKPVWKQKAHSINAIEPVQMSNTNDESSQRRHELVAISGKGISAQQKDSISNSADTVPMSSTMAAIAQQCKGSSSVIMQQHSKNVSAPLAQQGTVKVVDSQPKINPTCPVNRQMTAEAVITEASLPKEIGPLNGINSNDTSIVSTALLHSVNAVKDPTQQLSEFESIPSNKAAGKVSNINISILGQVGANVDIKKSSLNELTKAHSEKKLSNFSKCVETHAQTDGNNKDADRNFSISNTLEKECQQHQLNHKSIANPDELQVNHNRISMNVTVMPAVEFTERETRSAMGKDLDLLKTVAASSTVPLKQILVKPTDYSQQLRQSTDPGPDINFKAANRPDVIEIGDTDSQPTTIDKEDQQGKRRSDIAKASEQQESKAVNSCSANYTATVHNVKVIQAEGDQQGNEVGRSQLSQARQIIKDAGEINEKENWTSISNKNRKPVSKTQQQSELKCTDVPTYHNPFAVLGNANEENEKLVMNASNDLNNSSQTNNCSNLPVPRGQTATKDGRAESQIDNHEAVDRNKALTASANAVIEAA